MNTIHKYELLLTDEQTIDTREGAIVLSATEQNGSLVIYAMVDDKADIVPLRVGIFGTGNPVLLSGDWRFVNTVPTSSGYVWHVFVERN
jgi:hypothetical protein